MNVFKEIGEIVSKQLGIRVEEIKTESSFNDDLGADSLETVELVMNIEEKFGIEIPDDDIEKMKTVDDLVKYIESRVKQT